MFQGDMVNFSENDAEKKNPSRWTLSYCFITSDGRIKERGQTLVNKEARNQADKLRSEWSDDKGH